MTKHEAAVISAFTGILMGDFGDMHELAEQKFGRPIWTHEFASEKLAAELKELVREDFMQINREITD